MLPNIYKTSFQLSFCKVGSKFLSQYRIYKHAEGHFYFSSFGDWRLARLFAAKVKATKSNQSILNRHKRGHDRQYDGCRQQCGPFEEEACCSDVLALCVSAPEKGCRETCCRFFFFYAPNKLARLCPRVGESRREGTYSKAHDTIALLPAPRMWYIQNPLELWEVLHRPGGMLSY